ncbi:MAG: energy-coupled thiamine transporter ThiT [Christensenellaceae bacterium]|nr:energy-coupled thiamine transporter ThiT [Christensenellaceae bacterium]
MKSVLSQPFGSLDVLEKMEVIAFYLAIVLAVCIAVFAVILKKKRPEKLGAFLNGAKHFIFGCALSFAVTMLTLKISESVEAGEMPAKVFWPIFSILIVAAVLLGAGFIISAVKPEFKSKYKFIAAGIMAVPVIVSIVMLALHFKDVGEYYDGTSQVGLYISAVVLVALLVLACTLLSKRKGGFTTREMAYAAIALALAFALSYIRFFKLPQGGAVTLASMLPIMLFSYMFGIRKGIIVGVIYGVLQAIQDPWIIHPAQFFLDYPIAFGMLGLAGMFKELKIIKNPAASFTAGAVLAGLMRYASHVLSGIFAFACYAPEGYSAVAWGFLYNTFTLVDTAIVIAVSFVLFGSRAFRRLVDEKSADAAPSDDAVAADDETVCENSGEN